MKKPVFTRLAQLSIVVDDLDAYMRRYTDDYGIGPWVIMHFDHTNTHDMIIKDKKEDFDIRLAICDCLNVQWELIQPLSDNGTYAEFLKKNGPGIHHVCMEPAEGYEKTRGTLAGRGYGETLIGGVDAGGMQFGYVDLTKELGFIAELMNPPEHFIAPPPEGFYPPNADDSNLK